jgi:hypothetical protein
MHHLKGLVYLEALLIPNRCRLSQRCLLHFPSAKWVLTLVVNSTNVSNNSVIITEICLEFHRDCRSSSVHSSAHITCRDTHTAGQSSKFYVSQGAAGYRYIRLPPNGFSTLSTPHRQDAHTACITSGPPAPRPQQV